MTPQLAASVGTFSTTHIALTAAISAVLALAFAAWRLPRAMLADQLAVGVLTFAAVLLSANMPQLNQDGLNMFSANDWLAPVLTYVVLAGYADFRSPAQAQRFAQARAFAAVAALAVNVITI